MFVELRGGSLNPWILCVILWLGGEINFIAFIFLLATIVIIILLQIFFHPKTFWSFVPYLFLPNLFDLLHSRVFSHVLLWLRMIHYLTFFIQISQLLEYNYFSPKLRFNAQNLYSIVTLLIHAKIMVSIIYFLHWSLLITQWIFNACNYSIVFYMLNLLQRVIYFYSLDFYWSILILSGNILKVIHMYAMPYWSLYMILNYFKSIFIIGNEMQNLGYHFCQISQNVMHVF
jgi:hypothetical protein